MDWPVRGNDSRSRALFPTPMTEYYSPDQCAGQRKTTILSIMDAITSRPLPGRPLAVPNLLTYARIVAVPLVVVPLPSWPSETSPHHRTQPSADTEHVPHQPAATTGTLATPGTWSAA